MYAGGKSMYPLRNGRDVHTLEQRSQMLFHGYCKGPFYGVTSYTQWILF